MVGTRRYCLPSILQIAPHCEEQSDEASILPFRGEMDCFAALE